MSGSFEKSVKGGTKIKASCQPPRLHIASLTIFGQLAPPKSKYVEHILIATHAGEAGVAEIFRALQNRLRDSTWTIVFKALIIVHLMIREGEPNVTLKYVADSPSKLAISNFSDVQVQGTNIRHYYTYMLARAKAYKDTRIDWVREGVGRLKRQTIDKGLLRETEAVQSQIFKLLQCDLLSTEAENEITVCAFRLLTMDLLVLYGVMNEGTINVLEHYFEMSRYDAERALGIYKTFTKQTNMVVEFLSTARQYENATRLEIPKLKHAPTSLTSSLEEYLNDQDFEVNRRQYLAQQEAKKSGKKTGNGAPTLSDRPTKAPMNKGGSSSNFPEPKTVQAAPPERRPSGPAPDLIDFFASIETNQQPMASAPQQQQQVPNFGVGPQYQQQQQLQQTGVLPQQHNYLAQNGQQPQSQNGGAFGSGNPFAQPQTQQPVQQDVTGARFGGYSQQSFAQPQNTFSTIPENGVSQFQQQQDAFSSMPQNTGSQFPQPQQQQDASSSMPQNAGSQFPQPQQQQDVFSSMPQNTGSQFPQPQQSFNTGPQPFNPGQQSFSPPQRSITTGSSNPFRQSTMPTGASMPSYSTIPPVASPTSPQSTNPFARDVTGQSSTLIQIPPFTSQATGGSPFTSLPPQQQQPQSTPFISPSPQTQLTQQQPTPTPMTPHKTGTNPFARNNTLPPNSNSPFAPAQPLTSTPTGTNPFRQSVFTNQQTGQGWQAGQGTMGGFEQLPTMPVFPRPGQPQPQQGAWPG